ADAPLSSTGVATPAISITQANGTTDGFLDSGDFAAFSAKVDKVGTPTNGNIAVWNGSGQIIDGPAPSTFASSSHNHNASYLALNGGTLTGALSMGANDLTTTGKVTTGTLQVTGGTPGSGKVLTSDATGNATWAPVASQAYVTLTDGATITWTVAGLVNNAVVTLGGNRTLAFSGLANGMSGTLIVKQGATGGRTLSLPSQCTNKVIGGGGGAVVLSAVANAIDILSFTYDGTNCYWTYGKNYN
ncbi:MAG TPA: hypothetical protein DIS93_11575, partial [Bdellovibrionales bacterium]|nr:hypothetical protein [Bdellovibrionales bacterium]